MRKATNLTVDDGPMAPRDISRDLRARFGADYRGLQGVVRGDDVIVVGTRPARPPVPRR